MGINSAKGINTNLRNNACGWGIVSSSVSIKAKIKQLIETEKQLDIIFSDQKIVNILKKNDITIARRTVTKYRESLKIPSSLIRSKNL